jgi:hypothetical protein
MGKMNNGILDDFSGTIGKVVGSNWRGVSYMRAKSKKRTGALSDAQLEQQAKFAIAGKFCQSMNDLLTLGSYFPAAAKVFPCFNYFNAQALLPASDPARLL